MSDYVSVFQYKDNVGISFDVEAEKPTPENEAKAAKVVELIRALVENEEEACRLVREHGDEIEWD